MINIIKDGSRLVYDQGKFDSWCVYIITPDGRRLAPKDIDCFSRLWFLNKSYPGHKLFHDFLIIFRETTAEINPNVLSKITDIGLTYQTGHQSEVELWMTFLYAGMVAEENKEHAILKKNMKLIGVYQVLMGGFTPAGAASFSRGKSASFLLKYLENMLKQTNLNSTPG